MSGPIPVSLAPRVAARIRGQSGWGLLVALLAALALPEVGAAQVPVAARDLPRGAVLAAGDIAFPEASKDAGAAADRERVGWVTRRVISAGEPLREPAVAPPTLVQSGQTVAVIWKQGNIEVRARGQAARAGAMGERVAVRLGPHRRVEGVVIGPALVSLNSSESSR